jgi:cyclic pyranopterin phosphate synthase
MPVDSTTYSSVTRVTDSTDRRYISMDFTHFDEAGRARMVDISAKAETVREAIAAGAIHMRPETLALIRAGRVAKGDVLAIAQVAGIMGAKQTAHLIPMCHSLLLTNVEMSFATTDLGEDLSQVSITATVRTVGKTGAEMEALTAVSIAALTIYDMCKAVDREMTIHDIQLVRKSGGKSGVFERQTPNLGKSSPEPDGEPG